MAFTNTIRDFCNSYGNIASVTGLLVSLIGFWLAIRGITTAKKAAEQARRAATEAKEKVLKHGTLATFSAAVAVMEEIARLHRKKQWDDSLDRHSELRRMLIELKDSSLSIEEQTTIQGVIQQFNTIEKVIEKHVSDGKPEPISSRINIIVRNQMANVQAIAIRLKNN